MRWQEIGLSAISLLVDCNHYRRAIMTQVGLSGRIMLDASVSRRGAASSRIMRDRAMERVRVGVIGLGEVAQIIHLPILQALDDRFEIAAVCDVSPELLRVIGDEYRVDRRF